MTKTKRIHGKGNCLNLPLDYVGDHALAILFKLIG